MLVVLRVQIGEFGDGVVEPSNNTEHWNVMLPVAPVGLIGNVTGAIVCPGILVMAGANVMSIESVEAPGLAKSAFGLKFAFTECATGDPDVGTDPIWDSLAVKVAELLVASFWINVAVPMTWPSTRN